mmetsp:Transcript_38144/g.82979  ORF Transcript_38144/g.82979 Transcript_38144/m.82979 type:complete len:264 (-) Transcript_38144:3759-4550(-)
MPIPKFRRSHTVWPTDCSTCVGRAGQEMRPNKTTQAVGLKLRHCGQRLDGHDSGQDALDVTGEGLLARCNPAQIRCRLWAGLIDECREEPVGYRCQHAGAVILPNTALVHHQNLVRVHDSVQAMCNGEHGATIELCTYTQLDGDICLCINGRCCLIKHEHARPTQQRARHAQALALPHREVVPVLCHRGVQSPLQRPGEVCQLRLFQHLPDLLVAGRHAGWIHVVAHRRREEHRILWHDDEAVPQCLEAEGGDVSTVDDNAAL